MAGKLFSKGFKVKNKYNLISLIILVISISGCSVLEVPKPDDIIKSPLGSSSVKIGMTQNEVISLYGDPNIKSMVKSPEWGEKEREEWFYKARLDVIPLGGANYLTEDVYLYFDGDNLTNISKTPMGQAKEESKEEE